MLTNKLTIGSLSNQLNLTHRFLSQTIASTNNSTKACYQHSTIPPPFLFHGNLLNLSGKCNVSTFRDDVTRNSNLSGLNEINFISEVVSFPCLQN